MTEEQIAVLKAYTDQLHGLLNDPQPGLATWNQAVERLITKIAVFGGLY